MNPNPMTRMSLPCFRVVTTQAAAPIERNRRVAARASDAKTGAGEAGLERHENAPSRRHDAYHFDRRIDRGWLIEEGEGTLDRPNNEHASNHSGAITRMPVLERPDDVSHCHFQVWIDWGSRHLGWRAIVRFLDLESRGHRRARQRCREVDWGLPRGLD
jgi:hypothetical protein